MYVVLKARSQMRVRVGHESDAEGVVHAPRRRVHELEADEDLMMMMRKKIMMKI